MLPIARTKRAEDDLIAIWLEIATDNPTAADRVLDAFDRRWKQIAQYPHSGIARDDIAPGIRHLVTGNYLTLYRFTGETIEIIRVMHTKRVIDEKDVG